MNLPPSSRTSPAVPSPATGALRALAALLAVFLLASAAQAQTLPELLPEDVVGAVGVYDLEGEQDRLRPFLDEAERLGLMESLGGAVPEEAEAELEDAEIPDVPEALAGLEPMDLLGQEAWAVVSASPFRAIPAVSLIVRASDRAQEAFRTVIADAEGEPGVERLEESGRTLWTYVPQGEDVDLDVPIAYAQTDEGVLVASTDPEIVRFVLRRLSGADERTMADGETFEALRALGDGNAFGLLDAAPLVRSLEPFAAGFEAGPLLQRLHDAVTTAGPSVGLVRATDEGVESRGVQLPRADGPDAMLYELLTEGTSATPDEVMAFVPEDAVSITAGTFDVRGWWSWLDDVLASARSLGLPSASELFGMFGVDPQTALLDWAGSQVVQIATAPSPVGEPGMAGSFAADAVLLIEARDEEAAREGIAALFAAVGPSAGAFANPSGGEMVMPETLQIAGYDVQRLSLMEGTVLDAAVVDGWVLWSLSAEATEDVLSAHAAGSTAPADLADAAADLPHPVRGWGVSDDRRALAASADAMVMQLQMFAGLGGAANLDFEAVDEASADLADFFAFVSERMGTSRTVTTVEDGALRTDGFTRVDW